jgi:hypothetical protein
MAATPLFAFGVVPFLEYEILIVKWSIVGIFSLTLFSELEKMRI